MFIPTLKEHNNYISLVKQILKGIKTVGQKNRLKKEDIK